MFVTKRTGFAAAIGCIVLAASLFSAASGPAKAGTRSTLRELATDLQSGDLSSAVQGSVYGAVEGVKALFWLQDKADKCDFNAAPIMAEKYAKYVATPEAGTGSRVDLKAGE